MPAKGEVVSEKDKRVPSSGVAITVLSGLEAAVRSLKEANVPEHVFQGKTRFRGSEHLLGTDIDSAERARQYRQRDARGYIGDFEIREDEKSRIAYAEISKVLPARFSDKRSYPPFKSDREHVRLQCNHEYEIGSRVVVDAWRVPATRLTELLQQEEPDMDAYGELYRNLFKRRNEADIPVGAENVRHWVLGRPDEVVHPREQAWIANVMDGFSLAVRSEIAYEQEIAAEVAAGNI